MEAERLAAKKAVERRVQEESKVKKTQPTKKTTTSNKSTNTSTSRTSTRTATVSSGPRSSYNWATPGQCTDGALRQWRAATGWYLGGFYGNAKDWGWKAKSVGHSTGYSPRTRAIVVFQPGVAGANASVGHVAWVTAVNGNRVTIIEMNALAGPYNYNTRTVTHQGGMSYIYAP